MTQIHKSDYRENNFDVTRWPGKNDTLSVNLTYPNIGENRVQYVEINQESVRASDGIRVTYDYDRDGWSIQQPQTTQTLSDIKGDIWSYEHSESWIETAFVQSWAFEEIEDNSLAQGIVADGGDGEAGSGPKD